MTESKASRFHEKQTRIFRPRRCKRDREMGLTLFTILRSGNCNDPW